MIMLAILFWRSMFSRISEEQDLVSCNMAGCRTTIFAVDFIELHGPPFSFFAATLDLLHTEDSGEPDIS